MHTDRRRFLGLLAASPWLVSCAARAPREAAPVLQPPIPEPTPLPSFGPPYPKPDLSDARIVRRIAGIRPYRQGRLRLEFEARESAPVIHNYGHGGGGITAAWGSAEEVIRLAGTHQLASPASVTVIGAGIIGLTAARRLQEEGYRVRLVYRETTPHTVSDVAGGQWAPSLMAWGSQPEDRARRDRVLRDSLRRYRSELALNCGVSEVPNFVEPGYTAGIVRVAGEYLDEAIQHETIPIEGFHRAGQQVDTLLIEPTRYLTHLWNQIREHGVEEHNEALHTLDDAASFGDDFLVNATGMGARELCNDTAMHPIRGQLVLLEAQPLGYLYSHRGGYLFSRADALVLGGSVERDVEEAVTTEAICNGILSRHRRFFGV